MKFYIAYSINGTNQFLVATKDAESVAALGEGFSVVPSRRPNYNSTTDGFKVEWAGLRGKTNGLPYKAPSFVLRAFKLLESKHGWTIEPNSYRAFCAKNFALFNPNPTSLNKAA